MLRIPQKILNLLVTTAVSPPRSGPVRRPPGPPLGRPLLPRLLSEADATWRGPLGWSPISLRGIWSTTRCNLSGLDNVNAGEPLLLNGRRSPPAPRRSLLLLLLLLLFRFPKVDLLPNERRGRSLLLLSLLLSFRRRGDEVSTDA